MLCLGNEHGHFGQMRPRYAERRPLGACALQTQRRTCICEDAREECTEWDGDYAYASCIAGCGWLAQGERQVIARRVRYEAAASTDACVAEEQHRGIACTGTQTDALNDIGDYDWCAGSDCAPPRHAHETCVRLWPPSAPPRPPPLPSPWAPATPSRGASAGADANTIGIAVGVASSLLFLAWVLWSAVSRRRVASVVAR